MRFAARTVEAIAQPPDKYRAWARALERWVRHSGSEIVRPDVVIASVPPMSARRTRCNR